MYRLSVLHVELFLRRAAVQPRPRCRRKVRHVSRPARSRPDAGVCLRVSDRRDSDRDRQHQIVACVGDRRFGVRHRPAFRRRERLDDPYHDARTSAAQREAGGPCPLEARRAALAARCHDGAHAVVRWRICRDLDSAAGGGIDRPGRGGLDVAARRDARARRIDPAPRPADLRVPRAQDVASLLAEPGSGVVCWILRGCMSVRASALDAVDRRTGAGRAHASSWLRWRDGERVHLSRPLASRVEHAAHARAIQPDSLDDGPVVRDSRRGRSAAPSCGRECGDGRHAIRGPGAEVVPFERRRHRRAPGFLAPACDDVATSLHRPWRAPGPWRHRAAAFHVERAHPLGGVRSRAGWGGHRPVSVFCQRCTEASGCAVSRKRGRVTLRRALGLDTLADRYAYALDKADGYTSAGRVADRWVSTTCGYCSVGCGMFIGVRNGRAVGVRGNPDHPVNAGVLCPKGLSEHETIHAATRAREPLYRASRTSKFHRIAWDDAFSTMAGRFRDVQRRYGNDAVGIISTGQLVTEEFYALGKLAQLGLGTRNYDGNTTLCMSTAVSGYKRSFGSDGPPGAYEDLERADVIFLIGANIADNHPILWQRLEANPAKTLVVADPRVTKTAMLANLHLPVRPRSDLALINGIINILIESDLIDHAYIDEHTSGFEALYESVREYTPDKVSAITGLPVELLYRAASLYGNARAGFIGWTMGFNHSSKGTETVNAINNLALITGNIGRAGAAPFSITGQCNAMGTRESGFTSGLPGYRKFESEKDRHELATLWGIAADRIPTARGLAYPDIIEAALDRRIRA